MFTLLFGGSVFALVTAAAEQNKMAQNALLSYFTWNYVSVHLSAWICAYGIKRTLSFSYCSGVWWEKCAITQTAWNVKRKPDCSSTPPVALRDKWQITSKSLNWMIVDCCTGGQRIYVLLVGHFNSLCVHIFDTGPISVSLKVLEKALMGNVQ